MPTAKERKEWQELPPHLRQKIIESDPSFIDLEPLTRAQLYKEMIEEEIQKEKNKRLRAKAKKEALQYMQGTPWQVYVGIFNFLFIVSYILLS